MGSFSVQKHYQNNSFSAQFACCRSFNQTWFLIFFLVWSFSGSYCLRNQASVSVTTLAPPLHVCFLCVMHLHLLCLVIMLYRGFRDFVFFSSFFGDNCYGKLLISFVVDFFVFFLVDFYVVFFFFNICVKLICDERDEISLILVVCEYGK